MIWITLIATLLSLLYWLFNWLNKQTLPLEGKALAKVNAVIFVGNSIRERAVALGAEPEGKEEK